MTPTSFSVIICTEIDSGSFLIMGVINGSINYTSSGRRRKPKNTKKPNKLYANTQSYFESDTKRATYTGIYRRSTPVYASATDTGTHIAGRKEPQKYTGSLVKGISTMHKSNAVPVIDQEQMKDIARMRR